MVCLSLCGCMRTDGTDGEISETVEIPAKIERNEEGIPVLDVYRTDLDKVQRMDIETYLAGVVAGEMRNDWPMEALKAQAILARTFTLKFLEGRTSKYEGADISTDVAEAQAYSEETINDRVRQAVTGTRGVVMVYGDEFPNAWFHAHSGGVTELPSVALEYKEDPDYLSCVSSPDSEAAPEEAKAWKAVFTKDEILAACADCGVSLKNLETLDIGEQGRSGRAKNLKINGSEVVSAPSFRIQIGAERLRSTLIDSITIQGDSVTFEGRGFGHGVGMSQWGAYGMAENGATAQTIIRYYYNGVDLADLWE